MPGNVYRPEAPVSGDISKKAALGVCASHDDAGSGMALHSHAIGLPELIIGSGDKGFHGLHIHLLDPGQLSQFQNPISLQLLGGRLIFHIGNGKAVRIPLSPQQGKQGGFPDSLWAVQHKDGIELDPRLIYSGYRSGKGLPGNCTDIGCIFRTQIIDQEGIQPLCPIPLQGGEIFFDGMIEPLRRYHCQKGILKLGR